MTSNIWLTGDVHHMSMGGTDQKILQKMNLKITEVELCEPYLEISNNYDFIPTLFFTGKAVIQEADRIRKLMNKYKFCIGGHTFSAYQPILLSKINKKIFKSVYRSAKHQYGDIKKTSDTIFDKLGVKIEYWRNHAYQSNESTNKILIDLGFTRVSNEVDIKKLSVEKLGNSMYSYPINTLPDHENLPHSTEHVGGMELFNWTQINTNIVEKILKKNGVATLLLHPLCMYLENKFSNMEKLLSNIS